MAEQDFIRWYREKAGQLASNAPEGVWNAIENELDINEVWTDVQDELDVTEVWGRLSHQLDLRERSPLQKTASYALILSLLLLSVVPFQSGTNISPVASDLAAEKTVDCSTPDRTEEPQVKTPMSLQGNKALRKPENNSARNRLKSGDVKLPTANTVATDAQDQSAPMFSERSSNVLFKAHSESNQNPLTIGPLSVEKTLPTINSSSSSKETEDADKNKHKRFYAGFQVEVKNNWLMSQKTFYNLEKQSLNTTEITYGKEFGASFGYFVRPRLALQLSLNYSQDGQRYHEYIEGDYLSTGIDLRYIEMALASRLIQRRFLTLPNSSTSVSGGIYGGTLISSVNHIGENTLLITGYKKYNFGVTGTVEHELKLTKHLSASAGLHFKYGLTNIFRGDASTPAIFNQTNTASVGATIALRRYFQKLIPER